MPKHTKPPPCRGVVTVATNWPTRSTGPVGVEAWRELLRRAGATTGAKSLERLLKKKSWARSVEALDLIARHLGRDATIEIMGRLRWTTMYRPVKGTIAALVDRLPKLIPGHYRDLAREHRSPRNAFETEGAGWALAQQIRDQLANELGLRVWLPPPPPWLDDATLRILHNWVDRPGSLQVDGLSDLARTAESWHRSLAGQLWQIESDAAVTPLGRADATAALNLIVPHVDETLLAQDTDVIDNEWRKAKADVMGLNKYIEDDLKHVDSLAPAKRAQIVRGAEQLRRGLPTSPAVRERIVDVPTGGIVFIYDLKKMAKLRRKVRVQRALAERVTALFAALTELGWNDLLYQCSGSFAFRGKKLSGFKPQHPSARSLLGAHEASNHSRGRAIDVHVFENHQASKYTTMDDRLVCLFRRFGFRWGGCWKEAFDPHHFEY